MSAKEEEYDWPEGVRTGPNIPEGGEDKRVTLNQMQKAPPLKKTAARELGAGLLEISEQATELVDEIAAKNEELTKKINERLMEENLLK